MKLDKQFKEANQAAIHLEDTSNIIITAFMFVLISRFMLLPVGLFNMCVLEACKTVPEVPDIYSYRLTLKVLAPFIIYLMAAWAKNILSCGDVWKEDNQKKATTVCRALSVATKAYLFTCAVGSIAVCIYNMYRLYDLSAPELIINDVILIWKVLSILYMAYVIIMSTKAKVPTTSQST